MSTVSELLDIDFVPTRYNCHHYMDLFDQRSFSVRQFLTLIRENNDFTTQKFNSCIFILQMKAHLTVFPKIISLGLI